MQLDTETAYLLCSAPRMPPKIAVNLQGSDQTAGGMLEEIAGALRADLALVLEATPDWQAHWQHVRRGARPLGDNLPRDPPRRGRSTARPASAQPPAGGAAASWPPASATPSDPTACCWPPGRASRSAGHELEYAVAAGHYLGVGLERAHAWDEQRATVETAARPLVDIGRQLVEQRETVPLLEHIAEQAARLLRCERASIFLWDQARHELVGRPGPGHARRRAAHSRRRRRRRQGGRRPARPCQVDDVRADPAWNPQVDARLRLPDAQPAVRAAAATARAARRRPRGDQQDAGPLHAARRRDAAGPGRADRRRPGERPRARGPAPQQRRAGRPGPAGLRTSSATSTGHAGAARHRRARGPHRPARADPGRERHRQGGGRPRRSTTAARASGQPFVAGQLRRHRRDAAGERAVRPREGGVHRRRRDRHRQVRGGQRRHAVPRRDRRPQRRRPGQAAARAGGEGRLPRRRHRSRSRSTRASWPPPTATWPRRSAPASSARTCSTASTW